MEELTAELAQLALELIEEYGAEVTYTPKASDDYDPSTSAAEPIPTPPTSLKALVEDYDLQGSGQNFASGLIKSGDKKFTIAGAVIDGLDIGGIITFNDTAYSLVNVKQTYASSTTVLYQVQGRA